MNEIDKILGTKKKGIDIDSMFKGFSNKKKPYKVKNRAMDIDSIFPEEKKLQDAYPAPKVNTNKLLSKAKNPTVIVNNYYGAPPGRRMPHGFPKPRRHFMTALDGDLHKHNYVDNDNDGYPAYMDPDDNDPNVPTPMTKQINRKNSDRILKDVLGEE